MKKKKVHVDRMAFIPHNKPGEPEGIYSFPDYDSDEMMEFDPRVPMKKNVFKEALGDY